MDGTKTCQKCRGELPLSEFRQVKSSPDGYRHTCNGCRVTRKSLTFEEWLETRFWPKVHVGGPDDCWEWIGLGGNRQRNRRYIVLGFNGRLFQAHRMVWEVSHGEPIPDGLFICHRCDNTRCLNPAHLFAGTPKENTQDMWAKGRNRKPAIPVGERHQDAVLTEAQVLHLRQLRAAGEEMKPWAERYGISLSAMYQAINGDTWKHLGDVPDYPEAGRRGERHHKAKLTWEQVEAVREAAASGATYRGLGRQYGVHDSSIKRIVTGQSRKYR